ncbi:Flp pilus assembly complex ATPase component TadA, partial [Algoriphagus aestuarii]|nr:Flp pilus assembly complex ATPase component TadA [Algoriphagus aestuarii]
TGHLVMTSLHTADAASAMTRLMDMGVPPYLVASSVTGVIAQRLVRKICSHCTGEGEGCPRCGGSGYYGRVAAFEVLSVDEELQELVVQYPSANQIRHHVLQRGMV